jgi:hypothetical protein
MGEPVRNLARQLIFALTGDLDIHAPPSTRTTAQKKHHRRIVLGDS